MSERQIDWPAHLDRTPQRERKSGSKFNVSQSRAFSDLEKTLERMDVDDYRWSVGCPTRKKDDRPYSDARPDDPGIVLRWSKDGDQFAIACDKFTELRANTREIGLYLEEKRKMENRQVTAGDTEFANARLPSGDEEDTGVVVEDPFEVLGVREGASDAVIRAAYQERVKETHPDNTNGQAADNREFKRVKRAKEMVLDG